MVTCKRTDWSKGMGVPTPVNDDVATEVLNYLFNTNTWKTNPDALALKVRNWRARLWTRETPPPTAPVLTIVEETGDPSPETWADVAVRMRVDGKSWNEIKAATGKSTTTIRDAVKRAGVAA